MEKMNQMLHTYNTKRELNGDELTQTDTILFREMWRDEKLGEFES
jgi:hypothetical protein